MNDIEIEIQVKIERSQKLREFLKSEANFISENRQIDEYFTPEHKDFTKVRPLAEWLRIREEKTGCSINYKNWHFDDKGWGRFCDEYETKVTDKESMRKILMALNFKSLVIVDKTRQKYMYKDYEIAFDTVVGLGEFVEVEYKGTMKVDPATVTQEMIAFLQSQDCGTIMVNNGGYPGLLLFPNETDYRKA